MRGVLAGLSTIAVALVLAPVAVASHEPGGAPLGEDFAVGDFSIRQSIMDCCTVNLDAHSGPAGETPSGGTFLSERAFSVTGTITCLTVTGNRAVVGGTYNPSWGFLFEVEDNAATGAPDRMTRAGFFPPSPPGTFPPPPTGCPADLDLPLEPVTNGGLVVHDATPPPSEPTSKDQCKNGGWRDFGGKFRNQGQCIAFVVVRALKG